MATCFNFRCLSVSRFFIASIILSAMASPLISINFISTQFPMNGRVDEEISGDVYHSAKVFQMDYAEMERKFKIYVYKDGGDEITAYRALSGKYASEGYFFKNIRESSFLTDDPDQAHLFFIPISCHKLHQKVASSEEIPIIVRNYLDDLILKYPYWNRSLGADHFFLTCHDIDVKATTEVPLLVKNSIRVVCSAGYDTGFIPHKDVSLPLVMQPFQQPGGGNGVDTRTILGYWAGVQSSNTREALVDVWGQDKELDIQRGRLDKASKGKKFFSSKFCICPVGSRITSNRITMAIHYGCLPVILADYYDLPFNSVLNWRKFSVILEEGNVHELKDILKAKSHSELMTLHSNLIKVQRHFQWNSPPVKYDTFHMVLYELWLRRNVIRLGVRRQLLLRLKGDKNLTCLLDVQQVIWELDLVK